MMRLDINMEGAVKFTNILEQMHKSALPAAIRNTLSRAAFDVKKNTMPGTSSATFVNRQANFFKANSKVTPAAGFDIKTMQATVGFVSLSGSNKAVDELEQQEEGGTIGGRSFITTRQARVGGSWKNKVKSDMRIGKLQNVINAAKGKSSNAKQRFVRAAIVAKKKFGKNALVLGNKWGGGNQTLSRIDRITINKKKRTIKFKRTPIYTYRHNRKITVARTNFMKRASMESGMSLVTWYQDEAIKQVKRLQAKKL